MKHRVLLAIGMLGCTLLTAGGAEESVGISELYRLDRLPRFKESLRIGSVSSYDRSGGNDDGFSGKHSFVRKEGDALVIADLKGPGVIYRFATPTPTDDILEFLFDGEATPRLSIKFRDLFLGKNPCFPRPLVGFGAGGYYSYVPIPFAKSCVVRVRAPKVQFYQINYAIYPEKTAISSFDPNPPPEYKRELAKAETLFGAAGRDISQYSAPPGAKITLSRSSVTIPAHSSGTVFRTQEGGRIVGLRLSPAEVLGGKARDLILKISFDGDAPAVLCPAGDFFGYAWGSPAMRSLLAGTSDGEDYCYLPMPFDRSARVEIVSERDTPIQLNTEALCTPIPRKETEGKFYAVWRRENPTKMGEPYTFIETRGKGHLVGLVLQAQGFEPGKTLFFEGDDETTIDGEAVIHGTGSEDFFNGGWYDVPDRWEKRLSLPLSGCLGYLKPQGRTGAYRFLLGDAYPYGRSLRQTIEHSGEKNNIPTDYSSVAYLYAAERPSASLTLPALKERMVHDPEEVVFPAWWQLPIHAWSFEHATLSREKAQIGSEEVRYLSFRATGSDWFGPHFLSPICDAPAAGEYAIYIETVKGPDQGEVQLFQDENPVAPPVDLYAEKLVKSGRLLIGELDLAEGSNTLMIKLVGKNEKSSGLGLDLVEIVCKRLR